MEFEVAEAVDRIAGICGWDIIDQIWKATDGFNKPNAAKLICEHRADLNEILNCFELLKSFKAKDDENKIIGYIEYVRKNRATVLDDTEIALIHAFKNLSDNRRFRALQYVINLSIEEGANFDYAIIFYHRQGFSDEEITRELPVSVEKIKEVLSGTKDEAVVRKATKVMQALGDRHVHIFQD